MLRTSIAAKILLANSKIQDLLSNYTSIEELQQKAKRYRGNKLPELKIHNDNHSKILRLKRRIKKLSEQSTIHTDNSSRIQTNVNQDADQHHRCCNNCFRRELITTDDTTNSQSLHLTQRSCEVITTSPRKFRNIVSRSRTITSYILCKECTSHLADKDIQPDYNSFKFTWPCFIWYLLTDTKIRAQYEIQFIWKFIPISWRKWWLPNLKRRYNSLYTGISIDLPKPIVIDRSFDKIEWEEALNEQNLPRIANTCNKFLLPTVLCPWGCTEYIHKHGSIPFHVTLQKYMPRIQLCLTKADDFKFIATARDDYIRPHISDYDNWLLNPEWKVMPSVIIDPELGAITMTCNDHDRGNCKYMIHTCRQPDHNLPASRPDQFAPCVNRPRTVKPVKKSKFSTTYQMHEQRGSFNGIDTCSVTLFGKYNFQSTLSAINDARAMSQRPDIHGHLETLVKENIITKWGASGRARDALKRTRLIDFEPYYNASTYIPLKVALAMQNDNANPRYSKYPGTGEHLNDSYSFKLAWPEYIYPCQTLNNFGAQPHSIPTFVSRDPLISNNNNVSTIWLLSSLLLTIEPIWQQVSTRDLYRRDSWEGWLLLYLAKKSMHHLRCNQDNSDPFKFNQISSAKGICTKLLPMITTNDGAQVPLKDLLSGTPEFLFLTADSFQRDSNLEMTLRNMIITDRHESVIIENYVKETACVPLRMLLIDGTIFELRHVSQILHITANKWVANLSSRHGTNHCKWWHANRNSSVYLQREHPLEIELGKSYTLVYVKLKKPNITEASTQIMSHIGGQTKVQCVHHKVPMIMSTFRKGKCFCTRSEYYRCADLNCNIKCCKRCLTEIESDEITFITHQGTTENENDRNHLMEDVEQQNNGDSGHVVDDDTEGLFDSIEEGGPCEDLHNQDNDDLAYSPLLRDDFNEYVTTSDEPDYNPFSDTYDEFALPDDNNLIPSTDAGIYPFEISENTETTGALNDMIVTGNVLLNQCGTLLTRNSHQIKGSSRGHQLMQKICATTIGKSIPLLQIEAALFPSIHWKTVPDDGVISGAIPTPLLSEKTNSYGFQPLPQHIRTRLTSASSTTSTDPHYITHGYDLLTNLSATHLDTRVAMNRGLTAGSDTLGGLGVRGGNDSSGAALLGSIDSNQMVKNLCASQRIHPSSFFCTFTCAQSKHFGTKILKQWIDAEEWKSRFPCYFELSALDQREINLGMQQAAAGLLLRNWQETCKIFLDYLRNSPTSPFRKTGSIFARNEYQKDAGNLSHIHLMIEVQWDALNEEEKKFVDNLICANHLEICPGRDVEKYIAEGIFESVDDQTTLQDYAKKILRHNCSSRCQERVGPDEYRCRHSNNCRDSPDPKNDVFINLPNDIPDSVKERLVRLGLIDQIDINDLGFETPYQCSDNFFHPTRHIPSTNPSEDVNMSPVEAYTFAVCQSMQNIQLIKGTGGCNKYVCKYVGKIDEQNYVVVKADPNSNGNLVTQSNFLHNTKVAGSKINEDAHRNNSRDSKKPTGRKISLMEMLHVILKYPEVYTDLQFVDVPTYPLAFRKSMGITAKRNPLNQDATNSAHTGNDVNGGATVVEDAASAEPYMISLRNQAGLAQWRHHSPVEQTLIKDLYTTKASIDAITRFSIRPPELRNIFNATGEYFRWFSFSKTPTKDKFATDNVTQNLRYSSFIDGIQYKVKIRQNAVNEILDHISGLDDNDLLPEDVDMINYIREVCTTSINELPIEDDDTNSFFKHINDNLLDSSQSGLLPVYVFSQIRPTGGINFILHILLSMGRFTTEIEMTVHQSLRECLRQAKLIGPLTDTDSLQQYSNTLLRRYISEQLKYFSNSRRLIMHWIDVAAAVFDSVILHDEIPVTEMPPVQLTSILAIRELAEEKFLQDMKLKLGTAVLKEIGHHSTSEIIPNVQDIMAASKNNPMEWNPIQCHIQNPIQSNESYVEQQLAIRITVEAIDDYCSLSGNRLSTKNIGIRGFPGGGKTWCSMYCILYALSKGLNCLATAVMAKRATQLGGSHWHKFFCLPVEKRITPHRLAELAINKLLHDKVRHNAVMTLDVILADEFGQLSSEFISAIDIILRNLRRSNTMFGGVLIIGTLDHTQIQPWEGRPFLTSPQIIPTFKMVNLKHSVRTNNVSSQRIQTIARMNYRDLKANPGLVDEFISLASENFTFVTDWNDPNIVPSTFRVYSKRVPAVDAAKEFISNVKRTIRSSEIRVRVSKDLQKSRYTTSDWRPASSDTSNKLEEKIKPPNQLLFFRGAVYECTYNHKNGLFNQSQIALLYDLPEHRTIENWKPVKVLIAPPALKDVQFDMSLPKEQFILNGFKEVDIDPCPERPITISRVLQAQRKQYGLKHRVTGTIHAAMGDTYDSMASMISETDKNFGLWDKGQLIVIISRTRDPNKTIFVGDKAETLRAFESLLLKRTQWTDFMEHILDVITVNTVHSERRITASPDDYPFQVSNMELPQCKTGFVYMLSSLRLRSYTYIGTSDCIRTRIRQHNSGYGSSSTENHNLRPFAMMAYICGFSGNRDLMYSIEQKWKLRRNELISDGNDDPRAWAKCGKDVILQLNNDPFGMSRSDLKLVLLFR